MRREAFSLFHPCQPAVSLNACPFNPAAILFLPTLAPRLHNPLCTPPHSTPASIFSFHSPPVTVSNPQTWMVISLCQCTPTSATTQRVLACTGTKINCPPMPLLISERLSSRCVHGLRSLKPHFNLQNGRSSSPSICTGPCTPAHHMAPHPPLTTAQQSPRSSHNKLVLDIPADVAPPTRDLTDPLLRAPADLGHTCKGRVSRPVHCLVVGQGLTSAPAPADRPPTPACPHPPALAPKPNDTQNDT